MTRFVVLLSAAVHSSVLWAPIPRTSLRVAHLVGVGTLCVCAQVGAGMTQDQDVSHMALWAITACKLLISVDPRKYTAEAIALVTNKEIIAIDQDPLKLQVGLCVAALLCKASSLRCLTGRHRVSPSVKAGRRVAGCWSDQGRGGVYEVPSPVGPVLLLLLLLYPRVCR
jgi:hypothetical protein